MLTPRRRNSLLADHAGQATLEWALLMGAVALPTYWIFKMLLDILVEHYRMIVFLVTLPFP